MRLSHRVAAKKQLAAEGQREVVKYLPLKRLWFFSDSPACSRILCASLCWRCSQSHILELHVEVLYLLLTKNKPFLHMFRLMTSSLN